MTRLLAAASLALAAAYIWLTLYRSPALKFLGPEAAEGGA